MASKVAADQGLSVQEAAKYVGVHPQTIRNWIREGKLTCERYGPSGWLISIKKEDLDPFKK